MRSILLFNASRRAHVMLLYSPYANVQKCLVCRAHVTLASWHPSPCSAEALTSPARHACGSTSPFCTRFWPMPFGENIWYQWFLIPHMMVVCVASPELFHAPHCLHTHDGACCLSLSVIDPLFDLQDPGTNGVKGVIAIQAQLTQFIIQ